MTWGTVGLALVSAVFWGMANYFGGTAGRKAGPARTALGIQIAVFVGILPLSLIIPGHWNSGVLGWGALSALGGIVGFLGLYGAVASGSLGVVTKLVTATAVLLPFVVGLAQGDSLSTAEFIGVALLLGAILVLSQQKSDVPTNYTHTDKRAVVLGLIGGVGFGFATVMQGQTSNGDGAVALVSYRLVIALMLALYFLGRHESLRIPRNVIRDIGISGAFSAVGDAAFIVALQNGQLAIVPAIAGLNPGVTAFAARYWSHERIRRIQVAGICVGLVGIVIMKF